MPNRTIKTSAQNQSAQIVSTLSSLFALELLVPSKAVYLFSPWITDIELLLSQLGQFRALLPELDQSRARLSLLLNELSARGSQVYVATRPFDKKTQASHNFIAQLDEEILHKSVKTLHEKILVTEQFYLRGSMNFTYAGLTGNDEHVELTTEAVDVAQAIAEAKLRWENF